MYYFEDFTIEQRPKMRKLRWQKEKDNGNDLSTDKKQNFFQKNIESFVKQKIGPRVLETDQMEGFPKDILDQLAGNRLLGMLVSKSLT